MKIPLSDGTFYAPWMEYEDDNAKIWHDIVDANDKCITSIDWSPYRYMDKFQLERWLALGKPGRIGYGPLDERDLTFLEYFEENKNDETLNDLYRQCAEDLLYSTGEELSFFSWMFDRFNNVNS